MFHHNFLNTNKTIMNCVVDSLTWEYVESEVDPSFVLEKRNMHFGLALDGVNLFHHNNTQYLIWPVLMQLYNLPPYLVTKKFFIDVFL
jgi:hypothetical protein